MQSMRLPERACAQLVARWSRKGAGEFFSGHSGLVFCSVAMSLAASVLVLFLACLYAADARPEGAPAGACGTLMPEAPDHAANGLQTTTVPYEIDLTRFGDDSENLQYTPGGVYNLTFSATGNYTFRGFFVRARLAADDTFLTNAPFAMIASETNTRISSCTPPNSGITHNNTAREDFTYVKFQWTAPPEGTGTLYFGFAVVQTRDVYWANQRSAMLEDPTVVGAASGLAASVLCLLLSLVPLLQL